MFNPPRDLLKEYLSAGIQAEQVRQRAARLEGVESLTLRLLRWCHAHFSVLHHVWVYGLAFVVSMMVLQPAYGWINLAVVPVQVLFPGAIIAVAELPLMLVLSVLWDVGSALVAWIWKAVTKQRNW